MAPYVVTGTLNPDATGTYVENGTYLSRPAYEREDGAYWIWWSTAAWIISPSKGGFITNYWFDADATPAGTYAVRGTYTGTATVAEYAAPTEYAVLTINDGPNAGKYIILKTE